MLTVYIFSSVYTDIQADRKWTGSVLEVDRKWAESRPEEDRKWTGSGPELDRNWNVSYLQASALQFYIGKSATVYMCI